MGFSFIESCSYSSPSSTRLLSLPRTTRNPGEPGIQVTCGADEDYSSSEGRVRNAVKAKETASKIDIRSASGFQGFLGSGKRPSSSGNHREIARAISCFVVPDSGKTSLTSPLDILRQSTWRLQAISSISRMRLAIRGTLLEPGP